MIANDKNTSIDLVFTSAEGTKIYMLKDLKQISAYRGIAAEQAKRIASLCLTKTELSELIDLQMQAFNKQDFARAVAIGYEIKFRNSMICEENSLLDLAYIYLLIDGEDIDKPSDDFNKKKSALVTEQSDLKGFFLRTALQLADNFSQKPGADLQSYLEETKSILLRLSKFSQLKS